MIDHIAATASAADGDQELLGQPRPWGIWATLGWTLVAVIFSLMVAPAAVRGLAWWDNSLADYQFLFRYGDPAGSSVLILSYLLLILALVFAARRAGWSARDYLALVRPRGRYLLFGLLCVLLPLLITFAHALQFDVSQLFNPHGFDRARAANGLAAHIVAVALAAPVMEEILFRGFLFRGFSESWIGVVGTIALTSVAWALMHVGQGAAGMIDTALHGVAWGWLRWYTGSTVATIACHVANNAFFSALIVANLYGWFG
jgi:CAAX protease family protein